MVSADEVAFLCGFSQSKYDFFVESAVTKKYMGDPN